MTEAIFIIKIVLAALMVLCASFIIVVVLKQTSNSDAGVITGGSSYSDDNDSYYGKNAKSRKEYRLKVWTYVTAGLMAASAIAFLLMGLIK